MSARHDPGPRDLKFLILVPGRDIQLRGDGLIPRPRPAISGQMQKEIPIIPDFEYREDPVIIRQDNPGLDTPAIVVPPDREVPKDGGALKDRKPQKED